MAVVYLDHGTLGGEGEGRRGESRRQVEWGKGKVKDDWMWCYCAGGGWLGVVDAVVGAAD